MSTRGGPGVVRVPFVPCHVAQLPVYIVSPAMNSKGVGPGSKSSATRGAPPPQPAAAATKPIITRTALRKIIHTMRL